MRTLVRFAYFLIAILLFSDTINAQELNAKIIINHKRIEGTNVSVFENLETSLNEFVRDKKWTNQQYAPGERISCTFNITVNKYNDADGSFQCSLLVQSNRPVFDSNYTTVSFSIKDEKFNFNYQEFDKLEFRADQIDNELTALIAYYAYLIIGIDQDTMSPKGGTDALQIVQTIANGAQNFRNDGWKPFASNRNRYAIINDYLDGSMEPLRNLQYEYHRNGLDLMATNSERGRANIANALQLLKQAHDNKTLSALPQIFTEYKRDELVNIFAGKGLQKDKEQIYNILSAINASYDPYWRKLAK